MGGNAFQTISGGAIPKGDEGRERGEDLQHSLGQVPVVLLRDLRLIGGSVEHRGVVVDILDVDHHRRMVLVQVVRGHQPQFVLKTKHSQLVHAAPPVGPQKWCSERKVTQVKTLNVCKLYVSLMNLNLN
ncbi:hypothetical protein NPIL_127151 [Nephila pilipes]|uniref:Uncharacterized protein n=1 Tax=Nephila pilipes TaxID=299642 RepID=A0A8X6UPD2_NEPPI|nr:hypothetical protein NPIL_127151 [Nephila pilipes]